MVEETKVQLPPPIQNNNELIVYQLGEVKGLITIMSGKFDLYKIDVDKRLLELEKFRAAQEVADKQDAESKIDITKIILAAFGLISSVVAAALYFNPHR